jgi:hypothetical protein
LVVVDLVSADDLAVVVHLPTVCAPAVPCQNGHAHTPNAKARIAAA